MVDESVGTIPFEEQLGQDRRLSRFFTKLLDEALHLGANRITFSLADSNTFRAHVLQDQNERKYVDLKISWQDPIRIWLKGHELPYGFVDAGQVECMFPVAGKLVAGKLTIQADNEFAIDQLRMLPLAHGIEQAGFQNYAGAIAARLLKKERGLLLVSAKDPSSKLSAIALIRSFTGALPAGDLSSPGLARQVLKSAQTDLLVASIDGDNPAKLLVQLRDLLGVDGDGEILAAVTTCLIPRCCENCAQKISIEHAVRSKIPRELQQDIEFERRGKGCAFCAKTGFRAWVPVHSVIEVDDGIRKALVHGAKEETLHEIAYARGTRSLYEEGLREVRVGHTTLEQMQATIGSPPNDYLRVLGRDRYHGDIALDIQDDFFEGEADPETTSGPVGVFPEKSTASDAPLFAKKAVTPRTEKPVLLVAEDDPDQRSILEMVFRSANYDVRLAADGEAAWQSVNKQVPDLIITDLMMPKVDGGELLSRLKAHSKFKNIPVLVLTVVSDSEKEYKLLDLGADDYCEKTVQRKILLKRIENLLKRSQAEG